MEPSLLCRGAVVSLGLRVLPTSQNPAPCLQCPSWPRALWLHLQSLTECQIPKKIFFFFPPGPPASLVASILCCGSGALEEAACWCFSLCSSCCLRCGQCTPRGTWLCPATLLLSFLSGGTASFLEHFLAFLLLFIFFGGACESKCVLHGMSLPSGAKWCWLSCPSGVPCLGTFSTVCPAAKMQSQQAVFVHPPWLVSRTWAYCWHLSRFQEGKAVQSSACAACRSSRAPRGWEKCNIRVLCCVGTPALPLPRLVPALVLCREVWAGLGHEAAAPGLGLGQKCHLPGRGHLHAPRVLGYFCSINRFLVTFFSVFYWAEAQWGVSRGGGTPRGPGRGQMDTKT